jgi:shikimate kinase
VGSFFNRYDNHEAHSLVNSNMNIFLIGSMGVGKSSLGKRIANSLEIPFRDTDDEIVDNECKSINSIFLDEGEVYFRAQEAEVIRSFDATKKQIIATGGGLPMYHENMKYMLDNGLVVYLYLDIDTLTDRLFKGRSKRPAIKSLNINEIKNKLSIMLQDRNDIYEKAHIKYSRFGNIKKESLELSKYFKLFI